MNLKRTLALVLTIALMLSVLVLPASAASVSFTDVKDHWAEASINRWAEAEVLNGYKQDDGTYMFKPDASISRAEFAKVLVTILGLTEEAKNTFTDLENDWYTTYILRCVKAGIMNGYTDGTVKAEVAVKRCEAAKMLVEAVSATGGTVNDLKKFKDFDKIPEWCYDTLATAVHYGAILGDTDGNVNAEAEMTRAEVSKMLDRLIAVHVNPNGTVTTTTALEAKDTVVGNFVIVNANCTEDVEVTLNEEGKVSVTVNEKETTIAVENGVAPTVVVNEAAKEITKDATITVDGADEAVKDDKAEIVVPDEKPEEEEPPVEEPTHTHTWDAGKVTTEPTCYTAGVKTFTCTGCTETKTETIAATEKHAFGEAVRTQSCAVAHRVTVKCTTSGCTAESSESVEATVHNFVDGKCTQCPLTEEQALKFDLTVASGAAVKATVTDDYKAVITVDKGTVSASGVTLTATMQNVGSLGVDEKRTHTTTISTDMTADADLSVWLDEAFAFDGATVDVTVDGAKCSYVFAQTIGAQGEAIITAEAKPEEARAAWQALTANVETSTAAEDSKIIIANGSSLTIGTEKLGFEDTYTNGLVLNNFNNISAMKDEIKSAVKVTTSETDGGVVAVLKAGTTLQVGSSVAKLTKDATITVSGVTFPEGTLASIREAANGGTEGLVKALVNLVNDTIGAVDNANTVSVNISFK